MVSTAAVVVLVLVGVTAIIAIVVGAAEERVNTDDDDVDIISVEGEVDGREYGEWVRDSVIASAVRMPDASHTKSGGWLATYDQHRDCVLVYRLVEQIDYDALEAEVDDD